MVQVSIRSTIYPAYIDSADRSVKIADRLRIIADRTSNIADRPLQIADRTQKIADNTNETTNLFTVSAERCILYCRTNAIAFETHT